MAADVARALWGGATTGVDDDLNTGGGRPRLFEEAGAVAAVAAAGGGAPGPAPSDVVEVSDERVRGGSAGAWGRGWGHVGLTAVVSLVKVRYGTLHCTAEWYSTTQYGAVECHTVPFSTAAPSCQVLVCAQMPRSRISSDPPLHKAG